MAGEFGQWEANSLRVNTVAEFFDVVERLQLETPHEGLDFDRFLAAYWTFKNVDIPALRREAEQHAAQLRKQAERYENSAVLQVTLDATADFLCAPRREPEAE